MYLCRMKQDDLIWEFLPSGLKGLFEIKDIRKTATEFHIYLDEIRRKGDDDRWNKFLVGKGYTDYCTIQDHLTRGRATYIHLRKCKWLDKETGEIFSYDIDYEQEDGTQLTKELVAFLKSED